jgi:hypothetical protein
MRLTLTDDGCTYLGSDSLDSGSFTIEVENQTDYFGAFALGALTKGSTLADVDAYVEKEQKRWDKTQELRGPPTFYTQAVRVGVPAGDRGLLPADVKPGTYALTCFVDDVPTWRGHVAAQLDVTGERWRRLARRGRTTRAGLHAPDRDRGAAHALRPARPHSRALLLPPG